MKAELLRATVDKLAQHPEDFDMAKGIEARRPTFFQQLRREPCGTVCCIAGQVYLSLAPNVDTEIRHALEYGQVIDPGSISRQLDWRKVSAFSAEALGLTPGQAKRLFYVSHWPSKFIAAYVRAENGKERVAALRGAVEDFIATDGWEPPFKFVAPPEVKVSIQNGELVES